MRHIAHLLHLGVDGIVISRLRCVLHGKLLHLLRDTGSLRHLLHAGRGGLLVVLRRVHFLLKGGLRVIDCLGGPRELLCLGSHLIIRGQVSFILKMHHLSLSLRLHVVLLHVRTGLRLVL